MEQNNTLTAEVLLNKSGIKLARPESSFITITPEIAEDIINNRYAKNRKLKQNKVKYYADLMDKNQFHPLNGENLKFTGTFEEGKLIDGQHRLHAIILSGKTYEMMVTTNINEDLFSTIDRGTSRSDGDLFEIKRVPNARNIASMVSTYLKLNYRNENAKSNSIDNPLTKYRITIDQMFKVYQENEFDIVEIYADTYKKYNDSFSFVGPSKLAAMIFWTVKHSEYANRAKTEFWNPLLSGDNLELSSNARTCRNLFMSVGVRMKQQKKSDSYNTYMAWIIKAYNNHFIGKVLSESSLMNLDVTGKSISLK